MSGAFLDESFGKLAKRLVREKQQYLTEEDIYIHGDLPYYPVYVGKAWQCINKRYPEDKQVKIFRPRRSHPIKKFLNEWL